MDIGILVALTGIYKLAEKIGLLEHIKKYAEDEFDALYEKLIQDTVFDGIAKKFFKNNHGKCFEKALANIAPKYKTQKRRFLLHILTNPTIAQSYDDLKYNKLPDRRIFIHIFERVISKKSGEDLVDQFINNLYFCLAKDQEFINREVLIISDKIDRSKEEIIAEIRKVVPNFEYTGEAKEPFKISTAKLPTTQHALFGRDKELKLLDDAWANPHCHVLSFVAFGGVGKTALVNEWLNRMELDNHAEGRCAEAHWRGAERVYGWSFYSQGTREDRQASADTFFEDALKFFGYTGEPLKSPWDKGKLLAALIKERKTLLILDGLEPLQYPPGVVEGRLRDQGLQALLKELARFNNGLCLITTRCKVTDIEHTLDKTTHQIDLENLSPQAGMQLLREAGVTNGTDKELQGAAAEYDGHALALSLLGSYLATVYDGEIRKRDLIPQLTEDMEHGGHAKRVMESYEIWLTGTAELEILYLMGLFDRPAPVGAIDVLIKKERINGLTDKLHNISEKHWHYAVKHLRDLRLLSGSDKARPDTLDCHPLIREHFSQKLRSKAPNAWRMAHERLYEYYKNLPKKELPDTLEEMEPLFAAVAHGCQAGKHYDAEIEVYWKRIKRENEHYSTTKLGAFGADLAALSNFFEIVWSKPASDLPDHDKAVILSWAGFRLRALGRLWEAAQPMQASLDNFIHQKNWKQAAINAGNLSELYLTLGDVEAAVSSARQNVDFADRSGDWGQKMLKRTALADRLHQKGMQSEAETLFKEAEKMQKENQPDYPFLYGQRGFMFCDLLLSQGKVREVLERAGKSIEWEKQMYGAPILDFALHKLSLGWAYVLEAVEKTDPTSKVESDSQQATNYLNQAVAGLRKSGDQDLIAMSLIKRIELYRIQHDFPHAWDDLTEALEIAERGSMKLHLVDYHLEAARIVNCQLIENGREVTLSRDDMVARLKQHVAKAAELVQQTGYHRRDPEVELGYAGLFFAQGDQVKAWEHLGKAKALLDKMGIRCWDFEVRRLEQGIG